VSLVRAQAGEPLKLQPSATYFVAEGFIWNRIIQKEGMLARDNYSYKKYQREMANKRKKEEKRQSKLDKKNIEAKADSGQASNEDVPAE